jgi:hypothetical protein
MKKLILITAFLAVYGLINGQINRASRLYSYRPAPGQFINNPIIGTPEAAQKILTSDNSLVSLGAFGGSIVLGFEKPVKNDPSNPYGIDFTVFGNAFTGSSEPGIIWVMKDENGNGLPDDTWYQIAGSSYFHPHTIHNHSVTWYRQPDGSATWKDDQGNSGKMLKNEFHSQPYYPSLQYFIDFKEDSATYTGTLLGHASTVMNGQIVLPSLAFGYADNRPVNRSISPTIPDNPYTRDKNEGAGGDPVDISWAVDQQGNYVDLDEIHFVKIVTGALSDLGILGEISTEIAGVVAANPNGLTGPENLTVIHPHPHSVLVTDTLQIFADFFIKGRRQHTSFVFENSDRTKADISPEGTLIAKDGGTIRVSVYPEGYPEEKTETELFVRKPVSIAAPEIEDHMYPGETVVFRPQLLDQASVIILGTDWNINIHDIEILSVILNNGSYTLKALKPGITDLTISPVRFPEMLKTFRIEVLPDPRPVRVFVTAKTTVENLFPYQWIEISPISVNRAVENRSGDYSNPGFISLAQVVMSVLEKAGTHFSFRDDASSGNSLYLYSVESDGLFTYGWGGRTEPSAFARAWMIRHNGSHFYRQFDRQIVSDRDTVEIYHVQDILSQWTISGLRVSPDSAFSGNPISVTRWLAHCTRDHSGNITEQPVMPYPDQPITIAGTSGVLTYTDSNGHAEVSAVGDLPFTIHSGNDAAVVSLKLTTGIGSVKKFGPTVYPNPARDFVNISSSGNISRIHLTDASGRLIDSSYDTGSMVTISLSDLNPGIYLIVAEIDGVIYRNKIVKY